MIYLDNAATSAPKPQGVKRAVQTAMNRFTANPGRSGYERSMETAEMVFQCREKLADFMGLGQPEQVMFTLNCTHAINMVLKGVVKHGGQVVTSNLEHNAVMRPLMKLKEEMGVQVAVAQVVPGNDDETVSHFEKLITEKTSLVICTHASNVCGLVLPVARIGALCRQKGVLFAVDGAQSAGILPIHMQDMGIDYLCIPGHKGLYGPMGTGVLLAAKPIENTLIEGGTGNLSSDYHQPSDFPERMESGTINVPGIAGLSAGIDFVRQKGVERIHTYEIDLLAHIYDGLNNTGRVKLYLPRPDTKHFSPVLSFNVPGISAAEMAQKYGAHQVAVRSGLQCAPAAHAFLGTLEEGTVRVSTSAFNQIEEINQFVWITKKIIQSA